MSDQPKPVTAPKPKRQRNWRPKKRRKRIKLVQLTFFDLWGDNQDGVVSTNR